MFVKLFEWMKRLSWWLAGPYSKKAAVVCVLAVSLTACNNPFEAPKPGLMVVDVERVLRESQAADSGRKHLEEAKARLEKGWTELQKTWSSAPQADRNKVLSDGFLALNRQMGNEENAANNVVLTLMRQKVREWRQKNGAPYVIAKQSLLDVADAQDITGEIITMMNAELPQFADLPTVKVHERKTQEAPKAKEAAEPEKPAGRPAGKPVGNQNKR